MQRTRAESSLQRSVGELEQESPPRSPLSSALSLPSASAGSAPSATGPAASASTSTSRASRLNSDFASTPRGRLLQQLAAEATAAQRERSLRGRREALPEPPSYSAVMARVDEALQSAGTSPAKGALATSPTRLPKPSSTGAGQQGAKGYLSPGASPSKIPRAAAISADENDALRSARIPVYRP